MVHKVFGGDDEVPQDLNAFLVHPLNSSLRNDDSATALLHEYRSLQAIDKTSEENGSETECIEAQQVKDLSEDECGMLSVDSQGEGHMLTADESLDSILSERGQHTDSSISLSKLATMQEMPKLDARNETDTNFLDEELDIDNEMLKELFSDGAGDSEQILSEYLDGSSPPSPSPLTSYSGETASTDIANLTDNTLIDVEKNEPSEVEKATLTSTDVVMKNEPSSPGSPNAPAICAAPGAPTQPVLAVPPTLNQQLNFHPNMALGQLHPLQALPGNQTMVAPPMPYAMAPRFLRPMMVETSTGSLHLQPFINPDGQIGITPVACPPHMQPSQPLHVGMAWNRFVYPSAIQPSAQTVYPSHDAQYMPVAMNNVDINAVVPPPLYGSVVDPQQQSQSQMPAEKMKSNSSDTAAPTSSKHVKASGIKVDTLQKACAMSNIQKPANVNSHLHPPLSTANNFLKSPDSGFGEIHTDGVSSTSEHEVSASNPSSPSTSAVTSGSQKLKRRRSSMCSTSRHSKQSTADAPHYYQKRENDMTGYEIRLEVPTSCGAKLDEDRMTYLNKGQLYTLVMRNSLPLSRKSTYVKSVVTLRFRDESNIDGATKYWHYWCSRQPETDPKAIELDLKDSEGVVENSLKYNGVNSLTFSWLSQECVKVQLAVHCLSTDFSSQKGVKGLPLHVQIDTYDDINTSDNRPVHRAYAQIKIFCDKGAERKARDEEKRKDRSTKPSESAGVKQVCEQFHPIIDHTPFYSMADLSSDVFIFKPPSVAAPDAFELPFRDLTASGGDSLLLSNDIINNFGDGDFLASPSNKRLKLNSTHQVFLYVREVDDLAFSALLLETPTLSGLCAAIKEKFSFLNDIKGLYKRTRRGMLVKLDDKLVKHLLHESSYVIEFKHTSEDCCNITLIETDE